MNTYTFVDNDILHVSGSMLKQYVLKIKDLPADQKPREKLLRFGPGALSLAELLAVVLNSGTKKEGVLGMAGRIVKEYGEKSVVSERSPTKLSADLGIPVIKACQIVACGEIGRRFYERNSGTTIIRNAKDVFEYITTMRLLKLLHLEPFLVALGVGHRHII